MITREWSLQSRRKWFLNLSPHRTSGSVLQPSGILNISHSQLSGILSVRWRRTEVDKLVIRVFSTGRTRKNLTIPSKIFLLLLYSSKWKIWKTFVYSAKLNFPKFQIRCGKKTFNDKEEAKSSSHLAPASSRIFFVKYQITWLSDKLKLSIRISAEDHQ